MLMTRFMEIQETGALMVVITHEPLSHFIQHFKISLLINHYKVNLNYLKV